MINNIYRLVDAKTIEKQSENIDDNTGNVIVRPTYMSICHADQRYYQGSRPPEIMAKKLPMALIHESIGVVVKDPTCTFETGQRVAMVPNTPFEKDDIIGENYLRSSKFRASGFDGFMQKYVEIRPDRVVPVPDNVEDVVAAFSEICSVAYHVINRFEKIAHARRNRIGVWGEGNLGYITALLLRKRFPNSKIYVFGVVEDKLKEFEFADAGYRVDDIPEDVSVDHAFECVGSIHSSTAVNQMIDNVIEPEGTIALMGVSEEPVPINTRMILEKGLRLFGSSRSGNDDFKDLFELYKANEDVPVLMKKIIGDILEVKSIDDIHAAFSKDIENGSRKTVIHWDIR